MLRHDRSCGYPEKCLPCMSGPDGEHAGSLCGVTRGAEVRKASGDGTIGPSLHEECVNVDSRTVAYCARTPCGLRSRNSRIREQPGFPRQITDLLFQAG